MVLAFALLVTAGLYIVSGLKGQSIAATLRGELGGRFPLEDLAGVPIVEFTQAAQSAANEAKTITAAFASSGRGTAPKGSARALVDYFAAIGAHHGLTVVSGHRPGGTTTSGNVSDHSGNDDYRAARDMSNGSAPTPQMDAAVEAIAASIGKRVNGKREVVLTTNYGGLQVQILYRTQVGGNHDNHIHGGAHRV